MKAVESYLPNSMHLIHLLDARSFPENVNLITLDIQSLYTSITHEEAISALERVFIHRPLKIFLVDLLTYVLKNNIFQFNGRVYSQICGVAMGTKLAPALATIYIGFLEQQVLAQTPLSLCYGYDT